MSVWKEFLENKLLSFTGLEDKREYLHIEDLEKFFVGEVARIEKEISQNRKEVNKTNSVIAKTLLDYDYVILVGRINLLKELAGVE